MADGDADRRLESPSRQRRFQPGMNPLRLVRFFIPLSGIRRSGDRLSHSGQDLWCSEGAARRESRPPWFVVRGGRAGQSSNLTL